jgi:hypothetical protein
MPGRVQDVQWAQDHDLSGDRSGYAFNVWDERDRLALSVGFATREEANEAAEQIKAIIARAIFVVRSP